MSVFAGNMSVQAFPICTGCRLTTTNGRITIVHTYIEGCSRAPQS